MRHVILWTLGKPATSVPAKLQRKELEFWRLLASDRCVQRRVRCSAWGSPIADLQGSSYCFLLFAADFDFVARQGSECKFQVLFQGIGVTAPVGASEGSRGASSALGY